MNYALNSFSLTLKKHCSIILLAAMGYGTISCTHFNDIFHKTNTSYQQTHTKDSKTLPDLAFFPINGTRFRLSELKNIKAIVIIMRDISCPISDKYGHLIAPIEQKYASRGVQFIYNYIGQKNPGKDAKKDLKKFNFKGPYVIDTRQKLINVLGAMTTGEVFILTPERKLIYKGPLNNSGHHLSLKSVSHKADHYVTDVLQAVVSGKEIVPQELEAPGKLIPRPVVKRQVYFKDVAPIIREKCTSCHNPEGTGLMNFISYKDIAGRGAMFKYVIEKDLMPPWYVDPNTGPFRDDISLTLKEKALLLRWAEQGFSKEKKRNEMLWSKPKKDQSPKSNPDYVIALPEEIRVPAEGAAFYRRFVIQTNFKEEKWIKSVEYMLTPKIVHHFDIYIMDSSYEYDTKRNDNRVGDFDYYGKAINYISIVPPSFNSVVQPDINKQHQNAGIRLPLKAKLVVETHYEPIGQELVDKESRVLLNFYDKPPKYEMLHHSSYAEEINIPPHESNYKVEESYKIHQPMTLIDIATHTHLRGKASAIFITNPKGVKKRIFGIDPFTKTFERLYTFKKPLIIEKGSTITCINWFDNSTNNPNNPAPEKYVVQGLFLEQEMSFCFFRFLIPVDPATQL